MVASDHGLVGDGAIKQLLARFYRLLWHVIERALPIRILDEQGGDVGGVCRYEQLVGTGADEVGRVALGVAVCRDGPHAGCDVSLAVNGFDVLPGWRRCLYALGERAARLRN